MSPPVRWCCLRRIWPFTYQSDGTPVAIDDNITGRRTFTLDSGGRITGVRARGWSEQYTYNSAGDQK